MTGTTHGDGPPLAACEAQSFSHIVWAGAPGNEAWTAVNCGIEDFARIVISRVAIGKQFTPENRFQPLDGRSCEHDRRPRSCAAML